MSRLYLPTRQLYAGPGERISGYLELLEPSMFSSDIAGGLAKAADGISSMVIFERALRDGYAGISNDFPLVRENFVVMGEQMRNTLGAIAMAASVVTHLQLVVEDAGCATDSGRFRQCVDEHRRHAEELDRQLERLRGNSDLIRAHAEAIEKKLPGPWQQLAGFLASRSRAREDDIAMALAAIYESGSSIYDDVYGLRRIVYEALTTISTEVGSAPPEDGDQLLRRYGRAFGNIETRANFAGLRLQEVITELS